jgi:hypothetical protein
MTPRTNARLRALTSAALCAVLLSYGGRAGWAAERGGGGNVGTRTEGGLVTGTHVLHVTSLADAGAGTLRQALQENGPRVIVFDVSGLVHLQSPLKVVDPHVTIAGETAPAPGITLLGEPLIISTHDVVVEHIAIRPGPTNDPGFANRQDGVTLAGALDGSRPTYDILLRNLSISWAVDKGITLWRPDTRKRNLDNLRPSETTRVSVKDCIVSEMLDQAGHPKGEHSMGLLIGLRVQGTEVRGVLFAHNRWRNPVVAMGAQALVANNLIYDPGNVAVHFYTHDYQSPIPEPIRADIVNNVIIPGPSTKRGLQPVKIPPGPELDKPGASIYVAGNDFEGGGRRGERGEPDDPSGPWKTMRPSLTGTAAILPTSAVQADVLRYAGYRPRTRDGVDTRIVGEVQSRTGGIIDDIGDRQAGLPSSSETVVSKAPTDVPGLRRWLCERRVEVGGRPETCA